MLHDLWQSLDGGLGLAVIAALSIGCYFAIFRARSLRRRYPTHANGSMFQHIAMLSSRQYPFRVMQMKEAQGAVVRLSLPLPGMYVLVGESNTQRKILQDKLTSKPLEIYDIIRQITLGDTMVVTNGDKWHKRRKRVAPAFSSNQVKRMNQVALDKIDGWVEDTFGAERTEAVFDVGLEMNRVVLSAIVATAFQYDICEEEANSLSYELELALVEFVLKSFNPLRPLVGLLLPERRRAHVAVQRMHLLVRKIMENYKSLQENERTQGSIIQLIMDSDDAFPTEIDKQAQLLEMIIAGHDTTAYSVAWILICLAKNPDVQSKLRESIKSGDESYLRYVIKEGMRLYPVAADGSLRRLGREMTTAKGELLPEKTIAFLPNILLMRNPDVFRDPDKFDPSRWESPSREMLDSWTPFSLGSQNCVGQSLANAETNSIISRLCSEFELSIAEEGSPDFFLTWKPSGYQLKARKVV